jgi:hypothetical protein
VEANHPDGPSRPSPAVTTDDAISESPSLLVHECQSKSERAVGEPHQEHQFSVIDTRNSITFRNELVTPALHASLEKGFFISHERKWICYRRNDFAVRASFIMDGFTQENYTPGDFHICSQAVTGFKLRMRAETGNVRLIKLLQLKYFHEYNPVLEVAEVSIVPRGTKKHSTKAFWKLIQFKSANS